MAEIKKYPVGVSTSSDDVVKWDAEGGRLIFDEKDFQELPRDVVVGLTKINKNAYFIAKGIYDVENDPESGEITEDFLVSPEALRNQASSLINVDVKPGLVKYHARPEDINTFRKQGFRVATEADLLHKEDKVALDIRNGGYTDLRMLVRSEEVSKKYKAAKRKRNAELRSGKKAEATELDSKKELTRLGAGKSFGSAEFTEE